MIGDLLKPEFIPHYAMDRMASCINCPMYKMGQKYICGPVLGSSKNDLYCGCYMPKKLLVKNAECPQKKW